MTGSSPATWRTRRPLRVFAQRRRRPFERVAVVWMHRAESALSAGYATAGPDVRPGDPVRGEAARWLDHQRAAHERGLIPLWRGFHKAADKADWLRRMMANEPIRWEYSAALWHMQVLVWKGGSDLAVEPLEKVNRYTRANEPKGGSDAND